MSNSLYEEAIADAIAIREAAESRAKQHLVESMTPQIKDLVEKKLMEELEEDQAEIDSMENSEMEQVECGTMGEGEVEEISMDEDVLEKDKDLSDESYEIKAESFDVIKKLMTKSKIKSVILNKLKNLHEDVKTLKTAIVLTESRKPTKQQIKRINLIYKKLVSETNNIDFNDLIKSD